MHLVKRYSNRKLYDSSDRRQITLEGISELVRAGQDVKVVDNDSGEDITTVILTEILLERERHATGPFSKSILTGLVRASTGLVQLAEQEVERVLNTWVELGHMTEQEVLNTVDGVIKKRQKARGEMNGTPEAPTRDEFERLSAQVHSLNVQIGHLVEELRAKL